LAESFRYFSNKKEENQVKKKIKVKYASSGLLMGILIIVDGKSFLMPKKKFYSSAMRI